MASAYVSGRVTVRPVRVGLLVTPDSWYSLHRAVALAVSTWGGQGFPIFTAQDAAAVVREATALDVDVLYTVDNDPAPARLAREPGFELFSFQGRPPFLCDDSGIDDHLLPVSALLGWYRAQRLASTRSVHVTWDPTHPMERLLTVWFGQFGVDDAQLEDCTAWGQMAERVELGSDAPVPEFLHSSIDQLSVTLEDVLLEPSYCRRGIAVVDPDRIDDLIAWWNLRACGHQVIPWCERYAELLAPITASWIERIAADHGTTREPANLSIWHNTPTPNSPRLARILRNARVRLKEDDNRLDDSCFGPMTTQHSRHFSLEFDPTRGALSVPLPALDFLPRRSSWTSLGLVAADIDVWSESGLPTGTRVTAPGARRNAAMLPRDQAPFIRLRTWGRGFVTPVPVSREAVSLPLIHAEPLICRVLSEAGFSASVGENGRRMHHRIELLGAAGADSLANQPAAREVIRKALDCRSGVNAEALVGHARKHAGDWTHAALHWTGQYRDYGSAVVGVLGSRGILQPQVRITCINCGSAIRVPPSSLGELVACELCATSLPLAAYVAAHLGRPMSWELRATSAFDEAQFNETVPVMAALSVFSVLFEHGLGGTVPLHLVGVELGDGGGLGDLDFVTFVQDSRLPAVVIGEAKAGHPDKPKPHELLTAEKLRFLEQVQEAIRGNGIDCWIAFATSRPRLEPSEVQLLRDSADRALTPVFDSRGALLPVLPIVLTGTSLSAPAFEPQHPVTYVHDFPHLPDLGRETCIRELGLADVDYVPDASGWHGRPRWTGYDGLKPS
jgi:hypothetical protein